MNRKPSLAPAGKVPLISKIAYGFGDVGCNFSWSFVVAFLMIFYTDVFGIGMGAVATLMLISRFWDAVNDPIIGSLSDRTRSHWGRYRPWLLFGAPLTAIVLVLCFWAHPGMGYTAKIVYMSLTYGLLVLGYTCVNLPYGTLCGAMTQDMDERAQLNTSRSVAAMIAIGIINIITVPLVKYCGDGTLSSAQGFVCVAALYGVIFTLCHWFCFFKTKETVAVEVSQQRTPLKQQLRAVLQNKPFLMAVVGQLLFGFILYGRNADLIYYFKYVEGNENLFAVFSGVIVLPSIVGAALFPLIFKWTNNRLGCRRVQRVDGHQHGSALLLLAHPVAHTFLRACRIGPVLLFWFQYSHLCHHSRLRGVWRMEDRHPQRWFPIRLHLPGQQNRHGPRHLVVGAFHGLGRLCAQCSTERGGAGSNPPWFQHRSRHPVDCHCIRHALLQTRQANL